jgi:hypothetical protein
MGEPLFSPVWWLVPLWSAGLLLCAGLWMWKRAHRTRRLVGLVTLAMIAAIPLFPVLATQRPQDPPTQIVYRFDDHRWLELTGWLCEGALTYVDAKQHIRTVASPQFYRIVFYPYIHPSTRYIVIPINDEMAGFLTSRDGGRTFGPDARIAPGYSPRTETIPAPDDVKQFVVVDDRGYIETEDGRIIQSSLPEGDYWGLTYIDYPKPNDVLPNYSQRPPFRDLKSKVPEVKNYTGWTHMQCDPNVGLVPPKTSLAGIPGVIYSAEAYTIGAPVYFGWRAYRRMHPPTSGENG